MNDELLTPKEVAEYLKVSEPQVYRFMRRKINPLPYVNISVNTRRIQLKILTEWVKSK